MKIPNKIELNKVCDFYGGIESKFINQSEGEYCDDMPCCFGSHLAFFYEVAEAFNWDDFDEDGFKIPDYERGRDAFIKHIGLSHFEVELYVPGDRDVSDPFNSALDWEIRHDIAMEKTKGH